MTSRRQKDMMQGRLSMLCDRDRETNLHRGIEVISRTWDENFETKHSDDRCVFPFVDTVYSFAFLSCRKVI